MRSPAWLLSLPRLTVTVLAVAAAVFSSLMVLVAAGHVPGSEAVRPDTREVLGVLTALAGAVALIWRHRHPEVVTLAIAIPPLVFVTDSLAALIALAALAARRRDHMLWAVTAVVLLATMVAVSYDSRRHPAYSPMQWMFGAGSEGTRPVDVPFPAVLVVALTMTAIPVVFGLYRHARAEIATRDSAQSAMFADRARHDERTRIAREMHDVLGHRLSLLSLQAGALEAHQHGNGDAAQAVRQTARQSLDDLRQVVGVLRDGQALSDHAPEAPPAPYPSPSLSDLPELIDASRRSGIPINATIFVYDAATAPNVLATAAYRIMQEALTNVARHAPGSTAQVFVQGRPDAGVTVQVTNELPTLLSAESMSGTGTGLVGISERATALGGTSNNGPDGDVFSVSVWLPWPTATDKERGT